MGPGLIKQGARVHGRQGKIKLLRLQRWRRMVEAGVVSTWALEEEKGMVAVPLASALLRRGLGQAFPRDRSANSDSATLAVTGHQYCP